MARSAGLRPRGAGGTEAAGARLTRLGDGAVGPRDDLGRLLHHGGGHRGDRDGIQLSEAITGDGATIFRRACWMDLEGIVSKRIGSRYVSGRARAWLKTKNPDFERR